MKLKTVIPFEYDEIHYLDKNTYSVILNNETAIIDLNGDILVPFHKDLHELARKALTVIKPLQTSAPFVSYSSRVITDLFIPHHFFFLRDNSWIVLQEESRNGFYGIVDHLGNVIVPFEYKSVNIFSNGTIRVNDTSGHSLLFDYYGKRLLPGTYKNIYKIGDYFIVYSKENMKYGVMDTNGKLLLPFEFDEINTTDLPHGFIIPKKGDVDIGVFCVVCEWKFLYQGLEAMIFPLRDSEPQTPHLYIRQKDKHWLADYNGNMLMLSEMYYNVYGCNGLIQVSRSESFHGYSPVCSNSKSGIINFSGESVIPLEYDQIIVFGNSNTVRYFPVRINDFWGLIDEKNNMIIEPVFSEMLACYNGTIPVRRGDKWGLIQPSGKLILDCVYDVIGLRYDRIRRDFEYYSRSHVLAGKVIPVALNRHDCFALVDLNGCFLSGMEFDKVLPYNSLHKDRLLISRNGKWGVIQITDTD